MHNRWLEEAGLSGGYQAISCQGGTSFRLREMMIRHELSGVNLTTPLKELAMEQVDRVAESAARAGALNTVIWQGDQLVGHNTDGEGFVRGLENACGPLVAGMKVVLLGAGGAARGILSALTQRGLTRVVVLNRSPERARSLVERFDSEGKMAWGALTEGAFQSLGSEADLVIQTTAGGGIDEVAGWSIAPLKTDGIWADINYWMTDPPHQRTCLSGTHRYVTGGPMLVFQAVLAFQLFTGMVPNPDPFLAELR